MNIIEIYGEMRTKYGWNDGNGEPSGSYEVRDHIVRLINENAPPDAAIEAYGFDRPGMHNSALILYRYKADHAQEKIPGWVEGKNDCLNEPEWVQEVLDAACDNDIMDISHRIDVENVDNSRPYVDGSWKFMTWQDGQILLGTEYA